MGDEYTGTIIVIPTRNRAAIAEAAIRSVLQQIRGDVRVLVSDNSTSPEALNQLSKVCLSAGDDRLYYTRPPEPLQMTPHWDWALRTAFKLWDYSHVTFLTDRMIFKPGALSDLASIAARLPNKIISYMHDRVDDKQRPVRLDQHSWTGELFEVESTRLLELSSQSQLHEMLPRMLNCLVPRQVLSALKKRYGKLFDSYCPDFNFCYRSLEMVDSIVFYDAALLLHYGIDRSNGASVSRGELNPDNAEFMSNLRQRSGFFATQIPGILTARNAIAHEYCVIRNETQSPKLPPLETRRYLKAIAQELAEMTDPRIRRETEELLVTHGWTRPGLMSKPALLAQKLSPNRVARKLAREARALRTGVVANGRLAGDALEFATLEAALDYALQFPRPRVESQPSLEKLFGLARLPREVSQSARGS